MKLLDKIAKKLGYVREISEMNKPIVIHQEVETSFLASSIVIPHYDLDMAVTDDFNIKRWAKRKIIENMMDGLIRYTKFSEEPWVDGGIRISGTLEVVRRK